jgi:hypothetical protein
MNTAGGCQFILFVDQDGALKIATGVLRSLRAEIASYKDQYVNRAPSDMSKSNSQIRSLHDHVLTTILTPANSECILLKNLL